MAYNELLADRVRLLLPTNGVEEKKMMGGLSFMLNGKMCVGIIKDDLMARIDPAIQNEALQRSGCREMDLTGRPMKGFVFISPEATEDTDELAYWIGLAIDHNGSAKASAKKKKIRGA